MKIKFPLILFLIGHTLLFSQYQSNVRLDSHTIHTSYSDLYYEILGQGDTILLLHGCNQNIGWMGPMIDQLQNDHTVIVVDNPNHGYINFIDDTISYEKIIDYLVATPGFTQLPLQLIF